MRRDCAEIAQRLHREKVMDDEIERLKPGAMPADMRSWNIEDLQAYIDAMKAEIVRVEALIAQKNKVQSAAAALFGGTPSK